MNSHIVRNLWAKLWQDYSARVSYAQTYQQMIVSSGGTVANDHIAFRSLRLAIDSPEGKKNLGIDYLGTIVESLGYFAAGEYTFTETKLYARHYKHPEQDKFDLPKLFISELIVDDLPDAIATLIYQTVSSCQNLLDIPTIQSQINTASTPSDIERIVTQLQSVFIRPWLPPKQSVVAAVNTVTQYGAWVLLHGYAVNHFTGYINRQNTAQYPDIERTADGLAALGVPMKSEIEGSQNIGLRQTATVAVTEMVTVLDDMTGAETHIPWTYAYYELAQRYKIEVAGEYQLFDAFQGNNAQHLFEMTRKTEAPD